MYYSRAKSRTIILVLAGVCLAPTFQAAPINRDGPRPFHAPAYLADPKSHQEPLQYLDYDYSSQEVIKDISEGILVLETDKINEDVPSQVDEVGEEVLTSDQVITQLKRLLGELAKEGERVTKWRRSRGLEVDGGGRWGWHRVAVRPTSSENGHGTLISKGW